MGTIINVGLDAAYRADPDLDVGGSSWYRLERLARGCRNMGLQMQVFFHTAAPVAVVTTPTTSRGLLDDLSDTLRRLAHQDCVAVFDASGGRFVGDQQPTEFDPAKFVMPDGSTLEEYRLRISEAPFPYASIPRRDYGFDRG